MLSFHLFVPAPARGYTALFVELTYGGGEGGVDAAANGDGSSATHGAGTSPALKLTTTVSVVPNRMPYRLDVENHTGPWLGGP